MAEIPTPYNSKNPKKKDIERIAEFMNGFLGSEMLHDIQYPKHLQCDYQDLGDEGKKEWFEYTFHEVFKDAGMAAAGLLDRDLGKVELNLIKRRIVNFFNKCGFEYKN